LSLELLDEHRRVWQMKPALRRIYGVWFDALLDEVPPAGRALEVGAGPGFLRAHARSRRPDLRLCTSDIERTPWLDLATDCLRLPLRDRSLDSILGLDVIHHLARPASFFSEAARTLVAGGTIAVVEPWVTPFSYPIYRWLHQEGCRLDLDPWDPFPTEKGSAKDAFQGDGAVVWRLLRTTDAAAWRSLGFEAPRLRVLNAFAYLASLGFKPATLLPAPLAPALLALDRASRALAPWLGLRAFVVWEKAPFRA
jgi:SAM-dependent methyltransferase